MKLKKTVLTDYMTALAVLSVAIFFLTGSEEVSKGIATGLKMCAGILIPALFPFMALSGFLSITSAARILSIPLGPVTTKVLKLPRDLGATVLLSLVGGYPVGARSVSQLLAKGTISKKTAERMMCFCMNPGPSFLIAAVGTGLLRDKTAGLILFLTQTAATVIIGAAVSLKAKPEHGGAAPYEINAAGAFVEAVSGASSAMLVMCAFAVIFSGILPVFKAGGLVHFLAGILPVEADIINAAVNGLFEVTSGCVNAAGTGGAVSFGLISAIVSFGGLSVLFQIMSCFREHAISFKPLIISRIVHIPVAAAMAVPLYRIFCGARAVFAQPVKQVIHTEMRTIFVAASLLCMCAILTLSVQRR